MGANQDLISGTQFINADLLLRNQSCVAGILREVRTRLAPKVLKPHNFAATTCYLNVNPIQMSHGSYRGPLQVLQISLSIIADIYGGLVLLVRRFRPSQNTATTQLQRKRKSEACSQTEALSFLYCSL
jgi:hypothetical protein